MADKTAPGSQNSDQFPEIRPTKPTDDTPYISPVIGKLGYDTEHPWLFGLGTSPNNGVDFHVFLSFDGLNFDDNDIDKIWNGGTADRVKKEVDSATAEIPAAVSAASSAVSAAESIVAASKVNSDAIKAMASAQVAADEALKSASAAAMNAISDANKHVSDVESAVSQAQASAASDSKQLHDGIASAVASAKAAADDLKVQVGTNSAAIVKNSDAIALQSKSTSGAINELKVAQGSTQAIAKDAQSNAIVATQTASAANQTALDAKGEATTATQTASEASVKADNAQSQATQAVLTASGASVEATNAHSEAVQATVTASGAAVTATNANSQVLQLSAAANKISERLSSVETATSAGASAKDLADLKQQVTTNTEEISATSKALSGKVDQTTVDKQNKTIENLTGQINVVAGQLDSKADKSQIDTLTKAYKDQSAQQQIMADQIKNAVTETAMKDYVDSKGYTTQSAVQSIVDQKADTISETITSLDKKVGDNADATDKKIQEIAASVDGVQSTVKNKADQSTVTQLANTYQVKLTGSSLANVASADMKWTNGADNDYINLVDFDVSKIKKGTRLDLEFDYTADAKGSDCDFFVQLDDTPWTIWGIDYTHAVKGQTGHYRKIIVAGDWSKDKAKHIAIRTNKWKGTLHITNLTLTSGENVQTALNMLTDDMNMRVQKGDLISQLNLEAGRTLIQSQKIYMDADSVIMGPNTKAFIPSAAITSLDAGKITTGYIRVPMSDGNGNSVSIGNDGINIVSNNQNTPLFSQNRGTAKVNVNAAGMGFGATTNGAYEQLGALSVLLDNSDGISEGTDNLNGIGFVVETQQQYGYPYGGDFFSLARSIKGPPSYYNGFLYEASGSGKHEIGSHFFDPVYFHPFGADNYIKSTWVSWTGWDNNERYPALVQAGPMEGGIAFPKSGRVTLFDASGRYFTPTQWGGTYTGYQHEEPGDAYHDPSQAI